MSSRDVWLSKALSYTLRHGAVKQGIKIRPDGFVRVADLLTHESYRRVSLEDIKGVVENNDKKRFTLQQERTSGEWFIRANQGHTLPTEELELEVIRDPKEIPILIHGTFTNRWKLIKKNGLSRMKRNHIHFATGMPGESGVISGMRRSCDVYIFVDPEASMREGVVFYRSTNNVILSSGIEGVIPTRLFSKVVSSSGDMLLSPNQSL